MKLGIYYIPKKDSVLYQKGSELLGYDIRAESMLAHPEFVTGEALKIPAEYGFHMTITDGVYYTEEQVGSVRKAFESVVRLFPEGARFVAEPIQEKWTWAHNPKQFRIMYRPNQNLVVLHTLLIERVQKLGQGSFYSKMLEKDPTYLEEKPYFQKRIQDFHGPYIFDEFKPHFTLLNPYEGDPEEMDVALKEYFGESIRDEEISSLCLVRQDEDGQMFRIIQEFSL